ncbi:MAG: FecR family protein [Aestuariibaculum sp.]
MAKPNINLLLLKYFANEASLPELNILREWIADPNNEPLFKSHIKTNYLITHNMNSFNIDEAKANLNKKIEREKKSRRFHIAKYATITILLLALPLITLLPKRSTDTLQPKHEKLIINDEKITLTLDDGSRIVLNDTSATQIANSEGNVVVKKNGKRLNYNNKKETNKLIYNELKIPYGKRFEIKLSDGTLVHLNSGSSLKYPASFISSEENRKVFLTGEAFFDVAKNEKQPFIVNNNDLDIKVLGTKFNVSAYPEDNNTDVVLVEGSVKMQSLDNLEKNSLLLQPGHKGSFNNLEKNLEAKRVNTAIYTSWVNGNVVFRNTPFSNIIKKLERHYNVIIINNNHKLSSQTFNATIEVEKESIEDVLFYFNKVYQIDYNIENNTIIIN